MNKLFFFLITFSYSPDSFSQFNDSTHHHFSFSSTGLINKTQDAGSFIWNNSAGFSINQKKISQNTTATWVYGKQQEVVSNNDFSVNADLDYLQDVQKLYYWALVNFDKSRSLKINYRFQSGAGIGYSVIKAPDLLVIISDGFIYETNDLTDPLLGKDIYETVRNSFRIKYRYMIKKMLIFQGSHFIQTSLLSAKDYIVKSDASLTVKLNKWLGLNASFNYNKISRTNRENLLMSFGLTADRYF